MGNSYRLKKHVFSSRMVNHPASAFMGGLSSAAICGALGAIHGTIPAAVMATLGAIIGAPLGALLAASYEWDP
jgi:hypothetical protein